MAKNHYRVVVVEARPLLGEKMIVTNGDGKMFHVGVLQTADHVKLRFANKPEDLTGDKGFAFEVSFAASDKSQLAAFKDLVAGMEAVGPEAAEPESKPAPAAPAPTEDTLAQIAGEGIKVNRSGRFQVTVK